MYFCALVNDMEFSALQAIAPADGRYRQVTSALADYFSESALIRYRVRVEIEYFIRLCTLPLPQLKAVNPEIFPQLENIWKQFSQEDARVIKQLEKTTNHDVKAVEYFLREKFEALGLGKYLEFIHFGLTSQDINNTAIPLSLREANTNVVYPALEEVLSKLAALSAAWKQVPMLARTHGQPASPTRLGKEFYVFVERLEIQFLQLKSIPYSGKFGGATGNLNAHHVAYPEIDWIGFSNLFLEEKLGISRSQTTTQIEHYDNLAAWFDAMKRINTILIDLCRDVWAYISMDYFKQVIKQGEVGSSAMPHKVNPIDFENAEGNFGFANSMFEFFSAKLPISRLQRDLTDSTVLRNIGLPVAHSLIGMKSLYKGLNKLLINEAKISRDLEDHYVVVAEAIQTILRRENYPHPYEALKNLTRSNEKIDATVLAAFVETLDVSPAVKAEILAVTPHNYTGLIVY